MKGKDERYPDYPLFKGLQRLWSSWASRDAIPTGAAGVAGGAIVGFIIAYCLAGFVVGLVVLVAVVSTGIALIMLKQRKGLHTKKDGRGVYIYAHSKKL